MSVKVKVLKNGEAEITQQFKGIGVHEGIDLVGKGYTLDIVTTADNGVVSEVGSGDDRGGFIRINHGNGYFTEYCHLAKVYVKVGDNVSQGQDIGYMGATGRVTGAHVDYKVIKDTYNNYLDPIPYLCGGFPKTTLDPTNEVVYTVIAGDTLSGIARRYNTTYQALAGYNGIANSDLIYPGQKVRIPNTVVDTTQSYTVVSGDTLSAIAAKYGITYQKIASDNNIDNPNFIYPGQVLKIHE